MQALIVENGRADFRTVADPVPGEGEVLIKVRLAGICSTDLAIVQGYGGYSGILGHEFVGVVAAGSSRLAGKRVVGEINCVCGRCDLCQRGLSNHCRRRTVVGIAGRPGVFADAVCLPERNCHVIPDTVPDEEAVFTEPLAAAYQVLHQLKLESRTNVAVLGTGRLGLLVAMVLAKRGCRLTAIGRNSKTLDLLDRRGIRTQNSAGLEPRQDFDAVIECTGSAEGLPLAMALVRPRGTIVQKSTIAERQQLDMAPLVVNEITLLGSRCGPFGDALAALERRQFDLAGLVTRTMPLSAGVEALGLAASPDHIKILLKAGQ